MNFKERLESQKIQKFCQKILPAIFVGMLILVAFFMFATKYEISAWDAKVALEQSNAFQAEFFFVDFYVFSFILILAICNLLFWNGFYIKILAVTFGIAAAALIDYTNADLFTIKIFFFLAWIFTVTISIRWKANFCVAAFSIFCFVAVQFRPQFLGALDQTAKMASPSAYEIAALASILFFAAGIFSLARFLGERWLDSEKRAEHINMVMSQMTILNGQLQEYAKTRGKEAMEQERLRITRDLHDSCGYIFVNITSMMDAAMSSPLEENLENIEELFLKVRNLASEGLKETRKTLHAIRDLSEEPESNLNAIYDIKNIFSHVTGINIEIYSGNIKKDYSPTVNSIIMRTMQESLTNAIRHGHAKNIYISFWEDSDTLTMSVQDDGIGSEKIVKGIGLAGMEERLSKQGGELEISLPKEGGFKVTAKIPLTLKDKENSEDEILAAADGGGY